MPKLIGIEEKYINGIKVDKENDECFFNDEKHLYINKADGKNYISVTTLIGKYHEQFDAEFWSSYKALEKILDPELFSIVKKTLLAKKVFDPKLIYKLKIDQELFDKEKQAILDEYKSSNKEACDRGTAIHLEKELSFYNRNNFNFNKYGFKELGGEFDCKENYFKLDLERGVYPEFLISYIFPKADLRISGQIDLLVKDGNDIYIIDWKGLDINLPILTEDGWKTMGTLSLSDKVFDKDGNLCNILHISDIHKNPCYKITFDNGDSLIADEDHRWLISFNKRFKIEEKIMTTKDILSQLKKYPRQTYYMPKIYNSKALNLKEKDLLIDPYVLGAWLGDGSKNSGIITNIRKDFWKEIEKRGYNISDNLTPDNAEEHTIYGLRTKLNQLGLLNNKHIPDEYLLSSYEQRLDLLRGLMDTDGYYNSKRKRFIMTSNQDWQIYEFASLISSLGWKPSIFNVKKHCNGKIFNAKDVCFTTNGINPFLIRNQENIKYPLKDKSNFRNIVSIEPVQTIETKCIEVDSPTHTYLAGKNLIVTHNTNKEIKKHSYYNKFTKKYNMMKFPVNNLQDCNFNHYQLQLSMYAFMLQLLHPEYNIKGLKIVHIDHDDKQHEYDCEYLKDEVKKMLKHYNKMRKINEKLDAIKPINIC